MQKKFIFFVLSCIVTVSFTGCEKVDKKTDIKKGTLEEETVTTYFEESTSINTSTKLEQTEVVETIGPEQAEKEIITEENTTSKLEHSDIISQSTVEEEVTQEQHIIEMSMTMYASQDVNVRKGPAKDYERVGSLSGNQEVAVTGQADTGWYRISFHGEEAYVSNHYLTTERVEYQETYANETAEQPKEQEAESDNNLSVNSGQVTISKSEKEAEARIVAQQIADVILAEPEMKTDIDKIAGAAYIVSRYCAKANYTTTGKNYYEAYGVFISGEYSCAGATRALGMVLNCMGYEWEHVNENQWTHQWCRVMMDGQIGWADGQAGYAGYGAHPVEE